MSGKHTSSDANRTDCKRSSCKCSAPQSTRALPLITTTLSSRKTTGVKCSSLRRRGYVSATLENELSRLPSAPSAARSRSSVGSSGTYPTRCSPCSACAHWRWCCKSVSLNDLHQVSSSRCQSMGSAMHADASLMLHALGFSSANGERSGSHARIVELIIVTESRNGSSSDGSSRCDVYTASPRVDTLANTSDRIDDSFIMAPK
mmetsp:Transcript_5751/g.14058  ORF Transcript_5751/g.14058 Transcript_5751/m.14058 type:complete len:204 (-) Transcript_5751:1567-2178(-)